MAIILYDKLAAQEATIKARDADAKRQTPSPTVPQPGVHPGPGWKENWMATNTCHYFVIPNGDQDVIAHFICYDMASPFPELLATNRYNCIIHSYPLHACADIQGHTPLFSHDKLLIVDKQTYSNAVDYAIIREDDPILAGEVKYFHSHYKKANKIAMEMGCLYEALETKRQAMYHSSEHLGAANALQCIQKHLGHTLHHSFYFSTRQIKKIYSSI